MRREDSGLACKDGKVAVRTLHASLHVRAQRARQGDQKLVDGGPIAMDYHGQKAS